MDVSTDKFKSDVQRPGPFLVVLQTIKGCVKRLADLAILSDGERTKAGIYYGEEQRD
jgi:hypothetical protein